jgi:L-2-hydroxyglutarate oxidase LhgO
MEETKITIIGAGIIGLSIAYELAKYTSDIIVVDKNDSFGQETSARNSEVIHAGLYYPPDSLKAKTCLRGKILLYELCLKHNIPHKRIGKLVVASNNEEIKKIEKEYSNAVACGINNLRFLKEKEVSRLEPDIRVREAFFSPDSGIVDTHAVMKFLYTQARSRGLTFSFLSEIIGVKRKQSRYVLTIREPKGEMFSFESAVVINAAGLSADLITQMLGMDLEKKKYKLHYCKGQYFRLRNPDKFSIQHLIYPPATNISLGIHITPDLGKGLRLGPDARYVSGIDYTFDEKNWQLFYDAINKILPEVTPEDLIPDTVGIRPKLQKESEDFRDFVIKDEADEGYPAFINLIGIESPGFTSCLAIAEKVREMLNIYSV